MGRRNPKPPAVEPTPEPEPEPEKESVFIRIARKWQVIAAAVAATIAVVTGVSVWWKNDGRDYWVRTEVYAADIRQLYEIADGTQLAVLRGQKADIERQIQPLEQNRRYLTAGERDYLKRLEADLAAKNQEIQRVQERSQTRQRR